jgi:hypothetical protein
MEEIEKLKGGSQDPGSPGKFESIRLPNTLNTPAKQQLVGDSLAGEI